MKAAFHFESAWNYSSASSTPSSTSNAFSPRSCKSEGMAHHVGHELPVLTGLQALLDRARPHNATVFSVIDDPTVAEAAIAAISDICGGLDGPATGIVFTVPVQRVHGLLRGAGGES